MFRTVEPQATDRFCTQNRLEPCGLTNSSCNPLPRQFVKTTGSGEVEFDEFLTLTAKFLVEEDTEAMQEELREAFRMYDKEGNGYIPTSALREILRALDDKLTNDELDEMIAEIDTDGSGTVDFDEFMEMMTGD